MHWNQQWFYMVGLLSFVCKLCAVVWVRLSVVQRKNSAVKDPAASTEQRSDLGHLQEWHPLMGVYVQPMHAWLTLHFFRCVCVCACAEVKKENKRAHSRRQGRQRCKAKMLTSPLLINGVMHWVVMQWKFLVKWASKRQRKPLVTGLPLFSFSQPEAFFWWMATLMAQIM